MGSATTHAVGRLGRHDLRSFSREEKRPTHQGAHFTGPPNPRVTMATTRWIVALLVVVLAMGPVAEAVGGDRPAEPDEAAVVRGNTEFTFDLYARLRGREGNVFFSSYSLSNALAMTYAGARGPTATQMVRVLHFPLEGDHLHRA